VTSLLRPCTLKHRHEIANLMVGHLPAVLSTTASAPWDFTLNDLPLRCRTQPTLAFALCRTSSAAPTAFGSDTLMIPACCAGRLSHVGTTAHSAALPPCQQTGPSKWWTSLPAWERCGTLCTWASLHCMLWPGMTSTTKSRLGTAVHPVPGS
jgi:hypothetical protein